MSALTEAEGDGHFLFADGLVEEAYVSVDLREIKAKYNVHSCCVNGLRRSGEEKN